MSSRKYATLEPEERKQVVDGIYQQLAPQLEKAINSYIASVEPRIRELARNEVGKFAVTENQARAFIDGMIRDAAEKATAYFRPRWVMKLLFRSRTQ